MIGARSWKLSNTRYNGPGPSAATRGYTLDGQNRVTQSGGSAIGYDGRSNLNSDGVNSYAYDTYNHLSAFNTTASLRGDPLDRLMAVTDLANGTPTTDSRWFRYYGSRLLAEYGTLVGQNNGVLYQRHVPGPGVDETVVTYAGSDTASRQWLLADERGSTIAVANASGAATAIDTYDEYGVPGGGNVGRFQYAGQMWIPEIGLYHDKARDYSPTLGRFLQPDPIGYGDGLNLYGYVGGDPIDNIDPSGMGLFSWLGNAWNSFSSWGGSLFGGGGYVREAGFSSPGVYRNYFERYPTFKFPRIPQYYGGFGGSVGGGRGVGHGGAKGGGGQPQSGQRGVCARNPVLDALGKGWSSPNSALGLTAAGASYAAGLAAGSNPSFEFGDNALQLINSPINIDGRAYTLGNVQIYGVGNGPNTRGQSYTGAIVRVGSHEAGHSQQGQILGPLFLPTELIGAAFGDKNPLEVGADKFATGKSCSGF